MIEILMSNGAIALIETYFGKISQEMKRDLRHAVAWEDLNLLTGEVKHCDSLEDVEGLISCLKVKQLGRLEGVREAIYSIASRCPDKISEELCERAFKCKDRSELNSILMEAAGRACKFSDN